MLEVVDSYTLTPTDALHIRANSNYTDQFGNGRKIGEEWLVTIEDTESYIADVTEVMNDMTHTHCISTTR